MGHARADCSLLGDIERGDCFAYARAVAPVYPLVSKALMRLAAQPVTTAHLEGSFSAAKYLVGDHRTRMRPTVLKALTLLSCNRAMAKPFLATIAGEWLNRSWSPVSTFSEENHFASVADAARDDHPIIPADDELFDD